MIIFALFFFLIGLLFITMPELVGYIIGSIFILISINIFVFSYRINKIQKQQKSEEKIFSFGGYEFIKKHK